ncbi:fibronectin type III domain-containing protein [Nonomuraea sp. NPDC051941]|uniref:fibronectin type III domain-containing protein n=1 Tax=Nonomuraea sp. NPDC051941 TaxID=3364373 RepID=UPI0037C86FB4
MTLVRSQPVVYTTQSPSTSHTLSFGSVGYGNRIVLLVNSYAGVTGVSGGYDMHEWTSHTMGIRMYSKISYGSDSSVTVSVSDSTDRITIWMWELSNADVFYGSDSGLTSGSAYFGASDLPDGCTSIAGVSVYVTGNDTSNVSWPSGYTHRGFAFRDWNDGAIKRVWSSAATQDFVSGSLSWSQKLVTGLPSATPNYAWACGVWGPELDEEPPTVPGSVRLTGMTPTSVSITWDAATDAGSGVSGYGVYRNGVKEGSDQSGRTKTFTGLTSGVPYVFEVDAVDYKGNRSEKSGPLTITPIDDTTPPQTPVPRVTALGPGTITVAWDEPADETSITGYGVYLNGTKQGADQIGRTRTFSGLTIGGLYTVGVNAVDLLGNRSPIGTKTVKAQADTAAPTAPGSLRVVSVSQTSVTVAWEASTDDNVGVAGYGLYLGTRLVTQVPSQVFTFTGLSPAITYPLGVDAVDELGNRSPRVVVHATTLEDTSGSAPPFEYVFYDWDTHNPIDSLPLQAVSFELGLGGGGQLQAEIPLYDEAYSVGRVEAATRPERTIVVVYRGERPVWIGRLIDPQDYDSETGVLQITAEEIIGIYGRRFVSFTGPRAATLAHTEIDWLIDLASQPADKRWLRTTGVAGTLPVDREYRSEDFSRVLDTITDIAGAPGGFEFWVKPDWDQIADRPQVEFRRVNRDNPPASDLTLEYPGNVRKWRRSTRRALATVVHGKLAVPSGGVLLAKVTQDDLHAAGWPRLEEAYQFEGLTSQAALQAETQRAADASKGPRQVFEFELLPDSSVRWWEWELGSDAQVIITDHLYPERADGSAGLDRAMKIVSLRVEPATDGGELVTVTTAELNTTVDE